MLQAGRVVPFAAVATDILEGVVQRATRGALVLAGGVNIAMLLLAAERTEGVLREPGAFVWHLSLGDFCVNYELNAFVADALAAPVVRTALSRNVLDVFNEYGVQIMTPAYRGDPEEPKIVRREDWHLPPASPAEGSEARGQRTAGSADTP